MGVMSFLITLLFIGAVPTLIIYFVLQYISKLYLPSLTFEMNGYFSLKNVCFRIENKNYFLMVHINNFSLRFIWFRIRFIIQNCKVCINVKNSSTFLIKKNPLEQFQYVKNFVISQRNENSGLLLKLKEKFGKILFEKFIESHIKKQSASLADDDTEENNVNIDNLIRKTPSTKKENFVRNLIVFFDFLVESTDLNFKLEKSDFFFNVNIRKGIIGAVKGLNKHKEIHFMVILYGTSVSQFVDLTSRKFRRSFGENSNQANININSNSIYKSYAQFEFIHIKKVFFNLKFEYGIFHSDLMNTLNIKTEVNNIDFNISCFIINSIFKALNELNKFNYATSTPVEDEIGVGVECVEEKLLKIISEKVKKNKLTILGLNVTLLSDNHTYIYSHLSSSLISLVTLNQISTQYDNTKLHLLKSITEIKFNDVLITSSEKKKILLELGNFGFILRENIMYYHTTRTAHILTSLNISLPSGLIILTTKELDKYVELIVTIVCGLEKIDILQTRSYFIIKYLEEITYEGSMNLIFENISMVVHDDVIQGELNNFSLKVVINEIKNKHSKVEIFFSPIYINAFRKKISNYSSNLIAKNFHLTITNDIQSSHIDVILGDINVLVYDDHLIDIMKFVADFLTYNLKYSVKRKYKQVINKETFTPFPNRKDTTYLNFKNINILYYVDFKDLFTLKIDEFFFAIDDYMNVPTVLIYHQCVNNLFLRRKNLGLDLNKFYIKFYPKENELHIEFGRTVLNVYCFELMHPVITMFTYYHFFPLWIIYHMSYRWRVEEEYKIIYVAEFAKRDKVKIAFEEVIVNINQNPIANSAILNFVDKSLFLSKKGNEIKQLQESKCEQVQIRVKGFTLLTQTFHEKEVNDEAKNSERYLDEGGNEVIMQDNKPYYNKLTKIGRLEMVFAKLEILNEQSKFLNINNFTVILGDTTIFDQFNLDKPNSISLNYKMHTIFYKEVKSRKIKHGYVIINMDDLNIVLDDIKIIDKLALFSLTMVNSIKAYNFTENKLDEIVDEAPIILHDKLTIEMNNFTTVINSLDPKTGEIFNKLQLNVNCLSMDKSTGPGYDKLQLSVYYFTFGFDVSKKNNYPMIILPIAELNICGETFRVNVPSNCLERLNKKPTQHNNILNQKSSRTALDFFVMNTQSLTLFLNYDYLNTFSLIFENLWKRSDFMQKYLIGDESSGEKNPKASKKENHFLSNYNSVSMFYDDEKQLNHSLKLMVTVFDLKIIYLLNYRAEFDSTFTFHSKIQEQGYFGYVIRLYSSSIRYVVSTVKKTTAQVDELNVDLNLLTITCLNEDNLNDDKFFIYDKDILIGDFTNLKLLKNFISFFEMPSCRYLLINDVLSSQFDVISNQYIQKGEISELPFDFQNTLIKIIDVSLKRDTINVKVIEEIYTNVSDIKITWNKMNMDTVNILVFQDIIKIVDKILFKIKNGNANEALSRNQTSPNNPNSTTVTKPEFDLGRFNFIFELSNMQICIENEIKRSKVLITTGSKCVLKLSKLCLNEKSKDLNLEIIAKELLLYIPPAIEEDNCIFWIGDKTKSKYNLDADLFSQMVSIPNIVFTIKEQIKNVGDDISIFSHIDINIDKLIGDFAHSYFESFMNAIEVFIFSRGSSFAEEKISLDSRDNDLKRFKLEEIKQKIKEKLVPPSKIKTKQISFSCKYVEMTLLKDNKEVIKLLMEKFEGDHTINIDKSSETTINVSILTILDLLKIKNEVILSQQINESKFGDYKNKIEMIRFRKKDSYISIGTESKWYVLDYLEIGVQSLCINVTKYHCDFILKFFFNTTSNENKLTEEEYKKMLISNHSKSNKSSSIPQSTAHLETSLVHSSTTTFKKMNTNKSFTIVNANSVTKEKEKEKEQIHVAYPIYFKHVKINETKLKVSFFFNEGSPWNLKEAKVKFTEFEKKDKFYQSSTLIYRLIHHLKMMGIKNVGNVLASMLFNSNERQERKKEDEESHKRLLFGNLYSK